MAWTSCVAVNLGPALSPPRHRPPRRAPAPAPAPSGSTSRLWLEPAPRPGHGKPDEGGEPAVGEERQAVDLLLLDVDTVGAWRDGALQAPSEAVGRRRVLHGVHLMRPAEPRRRPRSGRRPADSRAGGRPRSARRRSPERTAVSTEKAVGDGADEPDCRSCRRRAQHHGRPLDIRRSRVPLAPPVAKGVGTREHPRWLRVPDPRRRVARRRRKQRRAARGHPR